MKNYQKTWAECKKIRPLKQWERDLLCIFVGFVAGYILIMLRIYLVF